MNEKQITINVLLWYGVVPIVGWSLLWYGVVPVVVWCGPYCGMVWSLGIECVVAPGAARSLHT